MLANDKLGIQMKQNILKSTTPLIVLGIETTKHTIMLE